MKAMFEHYEHQGLLGSPLTLKAILGRQSRSLQAYFEGSPQAFARTNFWNSGTFSQYLIRGQFFALVKDLKIRVRIGAELELEHERIIVISGDVAGQRLEDKAILARRHVNLVIGANGTDGQRSAGHIKWHPDGPQGLWVNANSGSRIYLNQTLTVVIGYAKAYCARRPGKALSRMLVGPNHKRTCRARAEHEDLAVINRKIEFSNHHKASLSRKIADRQESEERGQTGFRCLLSIAPSRLSPAEGHRRNTPLLQYSNRCGHSVRIPEHHHVDAWACNSSRVTNSRAEAWVA